MADELDALLERVPDVGLRSELKDHIERLRRRRQFGLVYESHLPERVRLPDHPIRRGSRVVRRAAPPKEAPQEVLRVKGAQVVLDAGDGSTEEASRDELVVVSEFGDPIYPGLKRLGSIERGGDKPAHLVIEGENYHALEALRFSHAGKIDCIYIDPPYNTGARDWKYDNDYVDAEDAYRHSKWLAFMERRLRLAKELLNPDNSVLIVTIDEREYLRLGLLLEQTYSEARIQMVSSVINPKGATRSSAFARTDEYIFFVMLGVASPLPLPIGTEWKVAEDKRSARLRWAELLRSGSHTQRDDRPNQFYPVFVRNTASGPTFDSIGEPYYGVRRDEIGAPAGCVAVWPIRSDGSEGRWQISAKALGAVVEKGYARLGRWREEKTTISYLKRGEQRKVEQGDFPIVGRSPDNSIVVDESDYSPVFIPGTQWRIRSHNAEQGGTNLLKQLIPGRQFPYPKSLYAVEDTLRFFLEDNPNAVVLDFFAGSGTTAHAIARLNHADGGARQSVSITNNEVSEEEAEQLSNEGLQLGDPAWEARGIFEYITRPRIEAALTGTTPDGATVKGSYKFADEFPMAEGFAENVEFVVLRYLDLADVELDLAYESVAPLLWLRAGGSGPLIDRRCNEQGLPKRFDLTSRYGVLFDPDHWRAFLERLPESATTVFVVTDSPSVFSSVAAELPTGLDVVRLYENYLSTFAINGGR